MKSIVIFIFLLFCLATNAYSEVVKKIDIKGNERISSATIIIFGDLITNKNYESDDINLVSDGFSCVEKPTDILG